MKKILFALAIATGLFSCQREYDTPPLNTLPEGSVITLDSLIKMYKGQKLTIADDISVYATVTMDEVDGNIYKNIYVQDTSAAINVRLLASGGLYEGDVVRMALRGCVLNQYNGVMQLDSVDANINMIKQEAGVSFPPEVLTIAEINGLGAVLQSKLVKIDSVQFLTSELNQTYANAATQSSESRTLSDCNFNQIIVRTSGFANFAGEKLAQGRGSITAIVSMFGSTIQLYIRSYDEINMPNFDDRCDDGTFLAIVEKDFNDQSITSGGWTTQSVVGTCNWELSDFDDFAECSNYTGSNSVCEAWYVSPALDLTTSTNPVLEFRNAYNYSGAPMEVYVLQNYAGDVTTATQTKLSPVLSSGGWAWVDSGVLDLAPYQASEFRIGFKYTGSNTDGSTWEIDNIIIREN